MNIKFFHGLWRRIEGNRVRSFSTYAEAVADEAAWEEDAGYTSEFDLFELFQKAPE